VLCRASIGSDSAAVRHISGYWLTPADVMLRDVRDEQTSSTAAKSTARPSCLVGVLYDISREKIFWWLINHFYVIGHESYRIQRNDAKYTAITPFKIIQGQRFLYQSKVHIVACHHASPDDTRAGRFRAGHVNLTFAARGQWGLRRACLASGQSSW